jgi:ABC-type antimicrobial peptide transport system permease subunit
MWLGPTRPLFQTIPMLTEIRLAPRRFARTPGFAGPSQISIQFLSIGLGQLTIGIAIGFFGTWMAGRAMEGILFEAPAFPLPTIAGTAPVMAVVSLLACLISSRPAANVSPMEALGGN